MDSFVKRKRYEIEVDKPEAAQEFEGEDIIIDQPEDISSPDPKHTKTEQDISVECVPDIAHNLSEDPRQPKLITYKQTRLGGQMRCFQKGWYIGRPWLEYSQIIDALFCYPCRLFQVAGAGPESKWTSLGFDNWKIAMEKKKGIKLHEESFSHLDSMLKWSGYKDSLRTGSIEVIVGALSVQALRDNRHYIKTVSQVITLCAVQDLPLRGHREGRLVDDMGEVIDPEFNCGSRNRGNFLEILSAFCVHDKVIKEKLNGPRNAQYIHHSVQDSILSILANSVRQDILEVLKTAKYFSLLANESRDCGKIEQISVCVRYICEGVLHEDFFNFVRAEGLDANSIMEKLSNLLSVMGVCSRDHMVAQCYDGASTMSERLRGLQALMRSKVCPMALYVHCWAHRLNLVVVACCQNIDKAVSFFASIQQLYTFFSASVPHDFFEKTQKVLGRHEAQHRELKSLSKTRWCCQAEACSAVALTLGAIIAAAEHFAHDTNADRRAAAQGIVNFIDTDFVVCLQLFRKVLTLTSYSANYMQDKHMDIGIAVNHIDTLKMSLSGEDLFDEIWDTSKALLDEHAIPQPIEKRRRICRDDAADTRVWVKSDYKVRLFDPVIRLFIEELDRRFSKDTCSVLLAMSALIPTSEDFLKIHAMKSFIEHYHLNEEMLNSEFTVFSNQYRKANPQLKTMLEVINFIEPHKMVYTELYKTYQIACTIPVTTAENERSFSCMKRVKTYLRSTMDDDRLGDLATLSINRTRASKIDMDEIVDKFDKTGDRRIPLS